MFSPWMLLGALLSALALFGSGYGLGKQHADNACAAAQAKGTQVAQVAANKESDRKEAVGAAREVTRETIRVVYRTIKEKTNAYIGAHKEQIPQIPPNPPFAKGGEKVGTVGLPLLQRGTEGDFGDCGLDADGLRLWNAANSGDAAPLSGEPDYTLPAAATRPIGKLGGSAAEPYRSDGAGGAVPGPAQEAGGM